MRVLLTRCFATAASLNPVYTYFEIAGRGELSRLVAAAGGVEIEDRQPPKEGYKAYAKSFGFFPKVPLLEHGDVALCQSSAIESYLCDIGSFKDLSPAQRGIDNMFAAVKGEALDKLNPWVFDKNKHRYAPDECPGLLDYYYSFFERQIPDGHDFVLGLGYPTKADCVILQVVDAFAPFGAIRILIDQPYDVAEKFPKLRRVADATKNAPGIKEYLVRSTTFDAEVMGLRSNGIRKPFEWCLNVKS